MDLGSVLILGSVGLFAIVLIIGTIMELRGKILFEKQEKSPKIKGRYGMGIMYFGLALFVVALLFRPGFTSEQVSPFVWWGYGLWIFGGLIAVARNEMLKMMVSKEEREGE
ncbi:hypothetical protein [Virgibacillus sp. YIM 98842]|uniref:hypothetical protein n=1 Tax=Virgibacillus sp. YIM 98842 TaxID=2663533 RepID=UPI0013DBAFC7|nr:hypothetical protein [Virgibacillus sp. YIM 98842]